MPTRLAAAACALLGLAFAAARPALAQATAAITARADISNTALIVGQLNQLQFGAVIPGTPTIINPRDPANAGKFVIHGNKNAEIRVTFALPTVLTVGPWTMPISFADDPVVGKLGCHRNQDQQNNCTRYTPTAPLVARIRNNAPPQNTFYVWIGGKVSPALGQQPGTYRAPVTLSVVYTGN